MAWSIVMLFVLHTSSVVDQVRGADWPQWLGPQRNGVWEEQGILEKFPEGGPRIVWRTPIAAGYSGPAVVGNFVFVTDFLTEGPRANDPSTRVELTGKERLLCLNASTGKQVWKFEYDTTYRISYPSGPRCTPTVSGGKVYMLGAQGRLSCVDAASGKLLWSQDFVEQFQAEVPIWGFTGHPLVDGQKLICLVGGPGSVAVAFDKDTGKKLWQALDNQEQGYCSPSIIEAGGKRQLLIWHPKSLNSLDPETGETYWTVPLEPLYGMSIQSPVKFGDLLYAGGIGNQGVCVKLAKDKPAVEEVWRGTQRTAVYPTCGAPFVDEKGVLYAACQQGHFRAVDIQSGNRLWESFKPTTGTRFASSGTCYIVRNGDRYFLMSENGDLIIAKLSAEGYEEVSRAHLIEPTNEAFGRSVVWTHPAFARQSMFMRNDKEIICVSLAK